jgi:hypothetical protein
VLKKGHALILFLFDFEGPKSAVIIMKYRYLQDEDFRFETIQVRQRLQSTMLILK